MSVATNRPILAVLGEWAAGLDVGDLAPSVIESAKLTLLHNVVVALAARNERLPGQDHEEWPSDLPVDRSATRLTDGRLAPADTTVVTNALAMGARAQHDEHPGAISHFGSTVIPPLLAAAEQTKASGQSVITAMVAGYEIGARIGAASVQLTSQRGLRPTGLYGPIAGAAAVGRVLGLSAAEMTSALAFAANTSAGVTQTWLRGTDEWRYHTAFASRNGYAAARVAAEGVLGADDTIEGANGFMRAFADAQVEPQLVLAGLGEHWALDDILLKPYPVCAFNQAPVQQLLRLREEHRLDPSDVAAVTITLTPEDLRYPGIDNTAPATRRAAALMCLRTCAAIALLHGEITLEQLDDGGAPEVRALAERITLDSDATFDTHFSTVSVERSAGEPVSSGPPAPVVYDDAVSAVLVAELQPLTGLDDAQIGGLVDFVRSLETAADLSPLLDLVRASAA